MFSLFVDSILIDRFDSAQTKMKTWRSIDKSKTYFKHPAEGEEQEIGGELGIGRVSTLS